MTTFNKIAEIHGANSQSEKLNFLSKILFDAEKEEGKFIVRWIEGNLKVGAAEQTIISALARAACLTPFNEPLESNKINMRDWMSKGALDSYIEKVEAGIKRAISEYPNYEALMEALTKVGIDMDKLREYCYIRPGTPVKPMLAKPTKGVQIILKRFENVEFTCEYKYDGFRAQIHYIKGESEPEVHVFSRNLEDMTETYPDVVDLMKEIMGDHIKDFIMDSEIVAYDRKNVRFLIIEYRIEYCPSRSLQREHAKKYRRNPLK